MKSFVKSNKNLKISNQLIYDNCLSFGRNPKLNNRKINHYIFGTRQKFIIFKLYELRYLLLKIYPLLHNLFLQERLNIKKKKKLFFSKNFNFQTENLPQIFKNKNRFHFLKNKFNKMLKEKTARPLPPKILFATTTQIYSQIVSSAAKKCRMPFHVNRWLSGAVTAATFDTPEEWSFLINSHEEKEMDLSVQKKFLKHKKNFGKRKKKVLNYQWKKKPTLIIIPDISNNEMILRETNSVGIPALGLVNSHCNIEITYPIFSNDLSLYSIHFFCHFISSLIVKEFVKYKHKIYTRKKKVRNFQFDQAKQNIFNFFSINKKKEKNSKQTQDLLKYIFKGRYFIEHFFQPRKFNKRKLTKEILFFKLQNFQQRFKKKVKIKMFSSKKLVLFENRKRLTNKQINFFLKKKILKKMKLIKKVRAFNFPKILREIWLPVNKPSFRYWNKRKWWFSSPIKLLWSSTPFVYQVRKRKLRKLMLKRVRDGGREVQREIENCIKMFPNVFSKFYRKRWSNKKVTKKKIKTN